MDPSTSSGSGNLGNRFEDLFEFSVALDAASDAPGRPQAGLGRDEQGHRRHRHPDYAERDVLPCIQGGQV